LYFLPLNLNVIFLPVKGVFPSFKEAFNPNFLADLFTLTFLSLRIVFLTGGSN